MLRQTVALLVPSSFALSAVQGAVENDQSGNEHHANHETDHDDPFHIASFVYQTNPHPDKRLSPFVWATLEPSRSEANAGLFPPTLRLARSALPSRPALVLCQLGGWSWGFPCRHRDSLGGSSRVVR